MLDKHLLYALHSMVKKRGGVLDIVTSRLLLAVTPLFSGGILMYIDKL